jgi:hypothetical protein
MERARNQLARKFSRGRVVVKIVEKKGYGLVAQEPIPAKTTIASYPVEIVSAGARRDETYTLLVAKKNGQLYDDYVGRVTPAILRSSLYAHDHAPPGIGIFANEPSRHQVDNARLVLPRVAAAAIKPGMIVDAQIETTRSIRPGEEILVCYGDRYKRTYRAYGACTK